MNLFVLGLFLLNYLKKPFYQMNVTVKALPLKLFILSFVTLLANNGLSQIFEETFNEFNGSTNGFDDQGGIPWTSSCVTCLAGDYWEVNNGAFENEDSNGPAVWETTADINISGCTNFEISFDIEEDGTLEACGTGCNSVDWVMLEYNLDNTGWVTPTNATFCAGPCADVNVVWSDDIPGGATNYSTGCVPGGSTLRIRITTQTWAGAERWRIDNVTVDCGSDPTVDAGTPINTCFGQTVTLTAFNPDNATISWNNGIVDGIAFSPSPGSDYYVVTADFGVCSAQDSVLVTVVDGVPFTLSASPSSTCTPPYNGIITLSGFTPGATYDITYQDGGGVVGPTSYVANGSGQIVLLGLPPDYYTNFIADSSGCISVNTTGATIDPPITPSVNAGPNQIVCEGDPVTLTATNPDMGTISWDNGVTDGVTFFPSAGVVMYHVTTDVSGCTATDSAQVTVYAIPNVNVPNQGPFSVGSGIQNLTANPAGGIWSASCGACIDQGTGAFDPLTAGVGEHIVCYTAGTAPCEDSMCVSIYVNDGCAIVGNISSNPPTCYQFNDGSVTINVQFTTGNVIFVIEDSLGNVVNLGNSNTANNLTEGWYYFTVSDDFPCTYVDSVYLADPPPLSVVIDLVQPTCYGVMDGMAIADTVLNYSGPYNQITYIWTPNSGANGLGEDTLYNAGGTGYTLLVTDSSGCSDQVIFDVPFPDELVFTQFGAHPAYCRLYGYQNGNGVVFGAATGGTGAPVYQWTNLQNDSTHSNTTWGGLNPGLYEIVVTDLNGCQLIDTITVDSLNPVADFEMTSPQFTADYEGTAPVEVTFINNSMYFANPNNPSADTTFSWNFNFDNPPGWIISHDLFETFDTIYSDGGEYMVCLEAVNKNGCSDTLCKPIIIYDLESFTPLNVFTPNGDGVNDEFNFGFQSTAIVEFECVIVNRWGWTVAELADITQSWDGTDKSGSNCIEGVYFYNYRAVAENGETIEGQGHVHLIREKK